MVYFRPNLELPPLLDSLQLTINLLLTNHPDALLIIGGDFNVKIGELGEVQQDMLDGTPLSHIRRSLDSTISKDGKRLIDFMASNGLICLNGRTPGDTPACFTFSSEVGNSVIDLVWVNPTCLPFVVDLRVHTSLSGLDHFPVFLELALPAADPVPRPPRASTDDQPGGTPASSFVLFLTGANCLNFKEGMLRFPRLELDFSIASVDAQYENMKEAILEEGLKSSILKPKRPAQGHRKWHKPWFDGECALAKDEAEALLKAYRDSGFVAERKTDYRRAASRYKNIIKAKREAHDLGIINAFANVRDAKGFWAAVKKCRPRNFSPPCISLSNWVEFYRNVYPPSLRGS